MNLLLLGAYEDETFLKQLNLILAGHKVYFQLTPLVTISEIALRCAKQGIEGIICSNRNSLEKLVEHQPDFSKPSGAQRITLDDWQGSYLQLSSEKFLGAKKIPVVVINPLEHLFTVPYGKFIAQRFLSKITAPESWMPAIQFTWSLIEPATAETYYKEFQSADLIAIDIETNPSQKLILCVSYCAYWFKTNRCKTLVIPYTDDYFVAWVQKFNTLPAAKIFQGGIYDNSYFIRFSSPVHNWLWDTLHLFHSWYSELPKRLDFITAFAVKEVRYWKHDGRSEDLFKFYRYNAIDAWATLCSFLSIMRELPEWAKVNYLEEFPLVFPSLHCGLDGLAVDFEQFHIVEKQKKEEAEQLLTNIRRLVGWPEFNPRSPPQMRKLLKALGCGFLEDTSEASLLKAQASDPLNNIIIAPIREYRKAAKLNSTYLVEDKFYGGRILYSLDPGGTDTGRLASRESPFMCGLQIHNIPRGDAIKSFIVSDKTWKFGTGDYPQAEARCVAYISGDEKLLWLVESGNDYHSWNIQEFFGISYSDVWDQKAGKSKNKDLRELSKRVNHGANYNMTEYAMLDTMGPLHVQKAKEILKLPVGWSLLQCCKYLLEQYAKTYIRVKKDWYQSVVVRVETQQRLISAIGWTRYCFGKPRYSKPALNSYVAHEPQNLSVSIINRAFYRIWRDLQLHKFAGKFRLKAQIHDEIIFEYLPEIEAECIAAVTDLMTIPTEVKDVGGKKRTMIIKPSMSYGADRWSKLK